MYACTRVCSLAVRDGTALGESLSIRSRPSQQEAEENIRENLEFIRVSWRGLQQALKVNSMTELKMKLITNKNKTPKIQPKLNGAASHRKP